VQGFVYLKFQTVEGAAAAQKALHGRWFASRQLVVNFEFAAPFSAHFRC
jgi:RNA-binding protein 39